MTSGCRRGTGWRPLKATAPVSIASELMTNGESVLPGQPQDPKRLKSLTTTSLTPIHPGEVLFHDFMEPLGLSQNQVARSMKVPPRRINEIVHGKRAVTADTAARLARYFGTSAEFWLNLQARYDLDTLEDTQSELLDSIVPLNPAA